MRILLVVALFLLLTTGCTNSISQISVNEFNLDRSSSNAVSSYSEDKSNASTNQYYIEEIIFDHLSVNANVSNPQKPLYSYSTEFKKFDINSLVTIIWPEAQVDRLQIESNESGGFATLEDEEISWGDGTIRYRKSTADLYLNELISYGNDIEFLGDKELEFLSKEEARLEVENTLGQLNLGCSLGAPAILSATKEELLQLQKIAKDDSYFSGNAKRDINHSLESIQGIYFFSYTFEQDGLPVFGLNDPSIQMSDEANRPLFAHNMGADILFSETGICYIRLLGVVEPLSRAEGAVNVISYSSLRDSLIKKIGDVILTKDYILTSIWLEYLPYIREDTFDQINLIPVWCCEFEVEDESTFDYALRFNAFTGDEIS